jgi:hypothetical protein
MSDREKGLAKAVAEQLPLARPSHCCQHNLANIQSKFGNAAKEAFWPRAYARTVEEYKFSGSCLGKD